MMTDPRTHLAENLDLFRFGGSTFDWARDNERLGKQFRAVLGLLLFDPRRWWTLAELSRDLGYPEASISARLRDCRKLGLPVPKRYVRRGLWEYALEEDTP